MNKNDVKINVFAVFLGLMFWCSATATFADDHVAAPIAKHVVIIGVDGMSPSGLKTADTPVMDELIQNGAYTDHARAVMPSSSSANWASMLMGAGPEQHGVTSNDWTREQHDLPPTATGSEGIFPTIFGVLKEQNPNAQIGCVYDWDGILALVEQNSITGLLNGDGPADTTSKAIEFISSQKPTLTFIHLDHVDGAGHRHGYTSEPYHQAIAQADVFIGEIVAALTSAEMLNDTLIIIASDHGGLGTGHGGATLVEMEIPIILHGPQIKPGFSIEQPANVYDIAATAAYALALQAPSAWIAQPIRSAFVAPAGGIETH